MFLFLLHNFPREMKAIKVITQHVRPYVASCKTYLPFELSVKGQLHKSNMHRNNFIHFTHEIH